MALLYGAKGGSANSNLYTIDPATAAQTPIGLTGFAITALAFDPTDGTLYGVTSNLSPSSPNSIITIDPTTGAGTLVAALDLTPVPDIAFRSDGQMFGWTEDSDDACMIDKATGVVTVLGDSGWSTFGDGNSFDSADVWYGMPLGGDCSGCSAVVLDYGWLTTIDTATGALTGVAAQTGGPFTDNPGVTAASFDSDDLLWAIYNDFPASRLVTIDPVTAAVTTVGVLANGFDALAWEVTSTQITLTPTSGFPGTSVSTDGTGFAPSTPLTATFNGSPLTLGGTTTTDGAGAFTGSTFTVPALSPGAYVVRYSDGTLHATKTFTISAANTSCANSTTITGLTGCVTTTNQGATSSGPDPLEDLLGTDGGHALWFKWTAPPLGPNGLDVTFTITAGTPPIGRINAAILRGACGAQIIPQGSPGTSVSLAPSTSPFTGRASGAVRTLSGIGAASPTVFGSYVQNSALPVTLTAHVASGETVYVEVDNYDGTAQGAFQICVLLDTHPVLTFRNYWRAEQ